MSMCCLNACIPAERDLDNLGEEPLIDLEQVVLKCALEQLRLVPPTQLTWRERLCPLERVVKLEVDKSFLGIQPSREMHLIPRKPPAALEGELELPTTGARSGTTVLFQSRYRNDTDRAQVYSFKTERQTQSSLELSLQRGFTVGQSLELDLKVPTGLPGCELSGKLGSQLQWSFERGKVTREEDIVTWAVDSQVSVGGNSTGEARLKVRECRWTADFRLPCRINTRTETGKIPVFVRRRRTGDLLQVIGIPCSDVVEESNNFFKVADGNAGQMLCELRGVAQVVCAVEQEVWLREATLVPQLPPSDG